MALFCFCIICFTEKEKEKLLKQKNSQASPTEPAQPFLPCAYAACGPASARPTADRARTPFFSFWSLTCGPHMSAPTRRRHLPSFFPKSRSRNHRRRSPATIKSTPLMAAMPLLLRAYKKPSPSSTFFATPPSSPCHQAARTGARCAAFSNAVSSHFR